MRIRLNDDYICIEISKNSQYLSLVSKKYNTSKDDHKKKKEFLRNMYHICAQKAQQENPKFLEKLLINSQKHIKLIIKNDQLHEAKCLKKSYQTLQCNQNDPLHVIRQKYLQLAKIYHPDRVATKSEKIIKNNTNKFQEIQEAYESIKYQVAS